MSSPPALQCANCQAPVRPGETACHGCGHAVPLFCPACGGANRAKARFCGLCGRSLAVASSEPGLTTHQPQTPAHPSRSAQGVGPRATAAPEEVRLLPSARAIPGAFAGELDARGLAGAAPGSALPLLGIGISLGLAVLAQSALLRTHAALPAAPLFLAACAVGGWTALRALPAGAPLAIGALARAGARPGWKPCLAAALAANAGSLALFGRNTGLTLAWLLFVLSVVLASAAFWAMDGRPGVRRVDWRRDAPWLAALAVLIGVGAALRLTSLGSLPFGLWYDEAYSGLQVQRILNDPGFRPVYVGGLAQEPSLLWYLMAASVKLLGPSVLALRLPTAIAGILGIPSIYLLGRELFDRRVGLIAAGLLTTLVWHLTFSRVGFNSEWSVTLDALGLFFLVRALKTGSWTAGGLAGISLGLGLHMYYTSRLMVAIAGFALLALWLAQPRARFQTAWRVALAAIVAGVVTASPIVEFAALHPAEFNSRLQQASVFTEVRDQHSYAPIVDNVKAHLLMFNLAGDRNARHNLPGQPELNFLLGGLFVLGLGICLARARRPEYLLLPAWCVVMLAGGVFSVAFEAPQSLRTIDEVNVLVLLCAIPLALLWQACDALPASLPIRRHQASEVVETRAAEELAPLTRPTHAWTWFSTHSPLALLPVWMGAALWMTDPLYRHLLTAIPGGMDSPHFAWSVWWVKYSLLTLHQSPLQTNYIFAPQQVNLAFHAFILLPALIALPLQAFLGLLGALNVVLLGSLVATSLTAYLLVRQETGSSAGAFVGSFVFTYAPYKLAHLSAGHLNVVMTWAVPLFAMFLLRWLRRGKLVDALVAGVSLGCVGLTDLNHLVSSLLLGLVLVVGFSVRQLPKWRKAGQLTSRLRGQLAGLAVIGLTGASIFSPVLLALIDGLRHGWSTAVPLSAPNGWAPDLLGYFVPLPMSPWLGRIGTAIAQHFHFLDPARLVFVGYTTLILSLLAFWARRHGNVRSWWLVAGAFWLLSLGPMLHAAGQTRFTLGAASFEVPLPFLAYRQLPLVGGLSVPGYLSLGLMLSLAVLAGHGAALVTKPTRLRVVLSLSLAVVVLAESAITPLALFSPRPDPVYSRIGSEPGNQAVLVSPAGWTTELGGLGQLDMAEMYFATIAHKPIVSGHVARGPQSLFSYYEQRPALIVLLFPDRPPSAESRDAGLVTNTLHAMGVGYIVLRHGAHFDQQLSYVTQTLHYPAFYQDGDVAAFRVPA